MGHIQTRYFDYIKEDLFTTSYIVQPEEKKTVDRVKKFAYAELNIPSSIRITTRKIRTNKKSLYAGVNVSSNNVKNNNYTLFIRENMPQEILERMVLHEIAHIKQLHKEELVFDFERKMIMWKKKDIIDFKKYNELLTKNLNEYNKLPWEVDANEISAELFTKMHK